MNVILFRKVYVLASIDWMNHHYKLFVLDVTKQNWEMYSTISIDYTSIVGKLIALRGNLYYFHDSVNQDFGNSLGVINHILMNESRIDLKVEELFLHDNNAFITDHIQLAPFSRRFFENVKNDGLNLKYTKIV